MSSQLSFADLRAANKARLPLFKNKLGGQAHSTDDGSDWSPADWMVAVVGELGEAANVMKKIRRGDFEPSEVVKVFRNLYKEFADVITYIDLLASQYPEIVGEDFSASERLDLGAIVMAKFNEVSDRVGADVKLVNAKHGAYVIVNGRIHSGSALNAKPNGIVLA